MVNITQMKDFLAAEALPGHLRGGLLPPGNRTTFERRRPLWEYIRSVSYSFPESPDTSVLAFDTDLDPVRFMDMSRGRKKVEYTPEMQGEKVIHFTSQMDNGIRWLAHFYGWFFFGDLKVDNYIKRLVRDYVHYKDEIVCQAGRIVHAIEEETKGQGWMAMHIRRGMKGHYQRLIGAIISQAIYLPVLSIMAFMSGLGTGTSSSSKRNGRKNTFLPVLPPSIPPSFFYPGDFQFKQTRLPVEQIFHNVEDLLNPGGMVYILTDEKNTTFFDGVKDKYRLRFLKDYGEKTGMGSINPNYDGMIEQVVASKARRFVGTYCSTFTG